MAGPVVSLATWILAIIGTILGTIFGTIFVTEVLPWIKDKLAERNITIAQINNIIIPKSAQTSEYLQYAFENSRPTAHEIDDVDRIKEIHTFLEEKSSNYHEDVPKGWEYLSLDIVEAKMFGVFKDSITAEDNMLYISDINGQPGASNDFGVDSYIIQKNPKEEHYGITLIQSKWRSLTTNGYFRPEPSDPLDKLNRGAKYIDSFDFRQKIEVEGKLTNGEINFLRPLVENWKSLKSVYHDESAADRILIAPRIRLVLVCHRIPDTGASGGYQTTEKLYNAVTIDAEEAHKVLSEQSGLQILMDTQAKDIRLPSTQITANLLSSSHEMDLYIGSITGLQLCNLYQSSSFKDTPKRDFGLLQMNVRRRLSWDAKVRAEKDIREIKKIPESINSGMRETIENSKSRHRFIAYNNGITMVCSEFKQLSSTSRRIRTPQIVNGGQTTEVLFEYFMKSEAGDPENPYTQILEEIMVPIKVIDTKGKRGIEFQRIAADIAQRVNHQNPTDARELYSNDERFVKLKSYFRTKSPSFFLGVKKGDWEWLVNEADSKQKGSKEKLSMYKYRKTARQLDISTDFGLLRWAILGGGSLAAARKQDIWLHKLAIFHTDTSIPPYSALPESQIVLDPTKPPFCLNANDDELFDGVLFTKIIKEEIDALNSKMNYKKSGFSILSDDEEGRRRKFSLGAIIYPLFTLLAVNEVLRIRCVDLNLTKPTGSISKARAELVSYVLGGNRDSASSRANTWPFFERANRSLSKSWSDVISIERSSLNLMRPFEIKENMSPEDSMLAVIELTTTNLCKILYQKGSIWDKSWRNSKEMITEVLDELLDEVSSGPEFCRLMSIPLGKNLESKQISSFNKALITLAGVLGL